MGLLIYFHLCYFVLINLKSKVKCNKSYYYYYYFFVFSMSQVIEKYSLHSDIERLDNPLIELQVSYIYFPFLFDQIMHEWFRL